MRANEVHKIAKSLMPYLPEFHLKGPMAYKVNDDVLQAVYIEDSGLDKTSFYVWVFFLPLYIPLKHLVFTFGKRLSNGKRWTNAPDQANELAMAFQAEALPFLHSIDSCKQISKAIDAIDGGKRTNLHLTRALAHSLAREGDRNGSAEVLKGIINQVSQSTAPRPWVIGLRDECERMLARIEDTSERQLLDEMAVNSKVALGLS